MFFGIINAFLGSLSQIFWKKAIIGENKTSSTVVFFLWHLSYSLIAIYFLLFTNHSFTNVAIIIILEILIIILGLSQNFLNQIVYKNEKMSVLTPYSNLNKVLIIVFSYLFFIDDISFTSFLITIFTAFVIIFTAIDFKNLTMSKNIKLFILGQVLIAVKVLIMGFLIVLITSIDYFILDSLLSLFLGLLIVLTLGKASEIVNQTKTFYRNAFFSSMLGAIAYVFSLIIIGEFGLIINILISFVFLVFSLIFSYIFFKDKPSRGNIILSIVILLLVSLGIFYK